jgi:hypothetical protein
MPIVCIFMGCLLHCFATFLCFARAKWQRSSLSLVPGGAARRSGCAHLIKTGIVVSVPSALARRPITLTLPPNRFLMGQSLIDLPGGTVVSKPEE